MKQSFCIWACLIGVFIALQGCKQDKKAGETLPAGDPGWPRQIELDDKTVIIHQPQIEEWTDYLRLRANVAFEVILKNEAKTHYVGAASVTAETETDFDNRQVLIFNKKVESVRLLNVDPAEAAPIEQELLALQTSPEVISLDRLLPMVADLAPQTAQSGGNNQPPPIFYSPEPAILVVLDGAPYWAVVNDSSSLLFAVNTNWDLFYEQADSAYFLLNGSQWLTARAPEGPWTSTTTLPASFEQLPNDENWAEVKANLPPKKSGPAPKVFYADKPAELILTEGEPQLAPIAGTGLQYVKNTDCDLYFHPATNQFYFLVSGRWFRAASLTGPWTFATPDLPEDFAKIAEDSDQGHVLATVPGTAQAKEAVAQASIPQTAEVSRETKAPDVKYNGEPQFAPIEGTDMSYAVNTPNDVIKVENNYYMCSQGIWFVSAYPTHGWTVCLSVPPAVYGIPPASPVHHVTYVHVYSYTPTTVVYGYTSGYSGIYISFGVPMYGTGFYYPPYYYPAYRPIYYPYPYSYGCRAYYNPYTGYYGRSAYAYGPYGGAGYGAAYNPYTGTYARGRSVYGPYGSASSAVAYNPRTGTHAAAQTVQTPWGGGTRAGGYNQYTGAGAATRQGHNPYAQWGESAVKTKNGEWAHTAHYTDANGTRRAFETSSGAKGISYRGDQGNAGIYKNSEGDLYVGKDGDVYKKESGEWQNARGGNQAQNTAQQNRGQQPTAGTMDKQAEGTKPSTADRSAPSAQPAPSTQPATRPTPPPLAGTPQDRAMSQPNTRSGQSSYQGSGASPSSRPAASGGYDLNQQEAARQRGESRATSSQSYQHSSGGASRPSGGGARGGGGRRG